MDVPEATDEKPSDKLSADKCSAESKPQITGAESIKTADKNGDGVLTIDEYSEKDKSTFAPTDANDDDKIEASEIGAAIKERLQEDAAT